MRQINRKPHKSLITCIYGRDSEKLSNSSRWLNPSLKYHLQLRTKGNVEGSRLGTQRGRRQWKSKMFGRKMFAGPSRDNRTQWRIFNSRLLGSSVFTHLTYMTVILWWQFPSWTKASISFRQLDGQSYSLSLLGLDCFHLEIITIPKRYFGVANFAPL